MERTPLGAKRCDCGINIAIAMKACSACTIKQLRAEVEKTQREHHLSLHHEALAYNRALKTEAEVQKQVEYIHQLQNENSDLLPKAKRAEKAEAEVERLSKRDCNATVQLCYSTNDYPFNNEDLKIVDVGVSDNVYIVESELFNDLQAQNKVLREGCEIVRLIKELSQGEGDAVQICHPNPDDGPANTIMVTKEFGDWTQYYGDSILDCLNQAVKEEG